jgi:hypothetical protein
VLLDESLHSGGLDVLDFHLVGLLGGGVYVKRLVIDRHGASRR